jgi:hypothetical protein
MGRSLSSVYGYPLRCIAPPTAALDRQPALPQRRARPALGHLHPLKYTLGLAARRRQPACSCTKDAGHRAAPGPAPAAHRAGQRERPQVLLAGNVYLHGIAPALEPRIMPVGTYIACSEAARPGAGRFADPVAARRCATPTSCSTTSAPRRPPHALRRPRQLQHRHASQPGRVACAAHGAAPSRSWAAKVEYAWGGFVDISMNRAPDFGRLPIAGQWATSTTCRASPGHGLALTGLAGRLVAEAMAGDASRFDVFARLKHRPFPAARGCARRRWCWAWPGTARYARVMWERPLAASPPNAVMADAKPSNSYPMTQPPAPWCWCRPATGMLGEHPFHIAGRKYIDAVRLAGALPLVVPGGRRGRDLDELLDLADGVLLTGSPSNVHPSPLRRGRARPALPLDPERDAWTLPLIPQVLERGMPLLAICRGTRKPTSRWAARCTRRCTRSGPTHDHRAPRPRRAAEVQYGAAHPVDVQPGGWLEDRRPSRASR